MQSWKQKSKKNNSYLKVFKLELLSPVSYDNLVAFFFFHLYFYPHGRISFLRKIVWKQNGEHCCVSQSIVSREILRFFYRETNLPKREGGKKMNNFAQWISPGIATRPTFSPCSTAIRPFLLSSPPFSSKNRINLRKYFFQQHSWVAFLWKKNRSTGRKFSPRRIYNSNFEGMRYRLWINNDETMHRIKYSFKTRAPLQFLFYRIRSKSSFP